MENELLKRFYDDEATREMVRAMLMNHLNSLALKKVYDGKSTEGIKDAKEAIVSAFGELAEKYGKITKPKIDNQSR